MNYWLVCCTLVALSSCQNIKWKRLMTKYPRSVTITNNEIPGGKHAAVADFPFQVSIFFTGGDFKWFCGGSLINSSWVLTAAHCLVGATTGVLRFANLHPQIGGSLRLLFADSFIIHPAYDPAALHDDIGLINLTNPIYTNPTDYLQKIEILPQSLACQSTLRNFNISGWSKTSNTGTALTFALYSNQIKEITDQECMKTYGAAAIIPNVMCALAGVTTSNCTGDPGGPLTILVGKTHYLVGVVTFVAAASNCGQYPTGFVEITGYLDWIRLTTGILKLNNNGN